ncbi:Conserved_hypothetical protein [Hexamita inflata]|uniref:Leucine-rich repeat protein n=1 Tax=Hexamita inflata TaxID=28002 RepID=A0AA86Q0V4_9EUKA|nr:Conserved hypothetical protein [Hexamita inflata]
MNQETKSEPIAELQSKKFVDPLEMLYYVSSNIFELELNQNILKPNLFDICQKAKPKINECKIEAEKIDLTGTFKQNNLILAQITELKELNISKNKLKEVPETVLQINGLQKLDVSSNKINNVKDLSKLTQLQNLDISRNKLEEIDEIATLNNLKILKIKRKQNS